MSNRFHSKFHRHSHHSYTDANIPDSGLDPIASKESPFRGDFVLEGALSANASLSAHAGYFYSQNTGLKVIGGVSGIDVKGASVIDGNLLVTGSINASSYDIFIPPYTFGEGLSQEFYNISVKRDNLSIKLNQATGELYTDFSVASSLPGYKYEPVLPLIASPISEVDDLITSTLTLSTDNETIYVKDGVLAGIKYNFTDGVSYNATTQTISAAVDDSTIKIIDGKLTVGVNFNGSGLSQTSQQIKVNVDNSTIKVSDGNLLYSGLEFDGGLVKGTGSRAASVSVNYDGSSIGLINGQLATLNSLKLSTPNSSQSVTGPVSFENQLSANQGITFSDGSVLYSGSFPKPFISNLAFHKGSPGVGMVVTSDNQLVAWGRNIIGTKRILSYGDNSIVWPPQTLSFGVSSISTAKIKKTTFLGYMNTTGFDRFSHNILSLNENGELYISGLTSLAGMLGVNPSTTVASKLYKVKFPTNTSIKDFACSLGSSLTGSFAAYSSDNFLYTWGANNNYELGSGNSNPISNPTIAKAAYHTSGSSDTYASAAKTSEMDFLFNNPVNVIKDIDSRKSVGSGLTLVLRDIGKGTSVLEGVGLRGTVWVSGDVSSGLGTGSNVSGTFKVCIEQPDLNVTSYQILQNATKILNKNIFNVYSSWILKEDGTVWGTGSNSRNQLGIDTTPFANQEKMVFVKNPFLSNIKDMADTDSGSASMCAITNDGRIFSWGANTNGECGFGDTNPNYTPTEIFLYPSTSYSTSNVRAVSIKGAHCSQYGGFGIIGSDGYLYVSGAGNWNIPLGEINSRLRYTFTKINVKNVANFEFLNMDQKQDTATSILILTKTGRVFIVGSGKDVNDQKEYFTTGGRICTEPVELTNFLV